MVDERQANLNRQVEALFAAHASRLVAFARTMTSDSGADDAVQETFLRVLLYGRRSSRPIDLGYLLVTLRNEIRRQHRRGGAGVRAGSDTAEAPRGGSAGGTPDDAMPSEEAVRRCVEGLKQPLMEALRLTAVEGLSGPSAARSLGVSASAFERQRRLAVRTVQGAAAAWLAGPSARVG